MLNQHRRTFAYPDHRLKLPGSHPDPPVLVRRLSEPYVEVLDDLSALLTDGGLDALLSGVLDVLLQELGVDQLLFVTISPQLLIFALKLVLVGVVTDVRVDDEGAQFEVNVGVYAVFHHLHNVETGKDGVAQVNVVCETEGLVVDALEWVGRSNDSAPGLQLGNDARLGDGDSLLFHGFVDGSAVVVVHFVELIDQADALVRQHHGSCLQLPLLCHGVGLDTGSQTHCRGALARRKHAPRKHLLDALQELGLGDPGVSEEQQVDVASDFVHALRVVLFRASEEREGEGLFDLKVAVYGGSDGVADDRVEVGLATELDELLLLDLRKHIHIVDLLDAVGLNESAHHWEALLEVESQLILDEVDADDLHLFSWLDLVHVVAEKQYFLGSGDTAWLNIRGRLL